MKSQIATRFPIVIFLTLCLVIPFLYWSENSASFPAGAGVANAQAPGSNGGEQMCDASIYDLGRNLPSTWTPTTAAKSKAVHFKEGFSFDAPPVVARPNAPEVQIVDVSVGPNFEFVFDPAVVSINVGDTVRWTWAATGHSVTGGNPCTANNVFCSPSNANCGDGETSIQGFQYSRQFNQAGNFSYFCVPHCGFAMTGTVIVNQVVIQPTENDFDGDGKADIAVYRPSAGSWFELLSSNGAFAAFGFGISTDKITPGDYDGDHKTDLSVFRPSDGTWYQILSQTGTFRAVGFGTSTDIPVANDYEGDGKTDIAVFRPSDGTWYLLQSSNGAFRFQPFGTNGDKPAAGDYDGDNKADFAVFRPGDANWYVLRSSNGSFFAQQFGAGTDRPVPGDYDGDGKNDLAVFRPSDGGWYLLRSTAGFTGVSFGISTDVNAPSDYDGDGKTDICVYRDGAWYMLRSSNGAFAAVSFGIAGDRPIPSAYIQ